MSVDKELAQAIEEAEAETSVPAVAQAPAATAQAPRKPKNNWGLLAGLLVVVAVALGLVFNGLGDKDSGALSYSLGVERLVKEQAQFAKRNIKVTGMLVKGTLMRRDEPCEYRFKLHDEKNKDQVLAVAYRQCVVPDTFRDMPGMDVQVTAEGKLAADGKSFEATGIMAKCPSKYEMQQRSMAGEAAPHAGKQASPLDTIADKSSGQN